MTQAHQTHYTFGDTSLASARLELLADTYAAESRAFLERFLPAKLDLAIDLGSGLGYTTELIQELRAPTRLVGYERSLRHLNAAKLRRPDLTFVQQDVMVPHFPHQEADLIYSRFLLTHLDAPGRALELWSALLRPTGLLMLEEVAHLASCLDEFQEYYAIVSEMQAHYGQELYIGRRLDALARRSSLEVVHSRQNAFQLLGPRMAQLHAMNLETWRDDPFVARNYSPNTLDSLETRLKRVATSTERIPPVTCTMAQVVLRR